LIQTHTNYVTCNIYTTGYTHSLHEVNKIYYYSSVGDMYTPSPKPSISQFINNNIF